MIRSAFLQQVGDGQRDTEIRLLAEELPRRGILCEFFLEKHWNRVRPRVRVSTLVAGLIPVVLSAVRAVGGQEPEVEDYPAALQRFLHRRMWKRTVREVVALLQEGMSRPFFAKPLSKVKRFRGHVLETFDDLRHLARASDGLEVVCSEVVEWRSEFRVYVAQGEIVFMGHYLGDVREVPDQAVVREAVALFEQSGCAPAGYGIDFGVLGSGETALVEVNNGFALGAYGIPAGAYADVIMARWEQMAGGA